MEFAAFAMNFELDFEAQRDRDRELREVGDQLLGAEMDSIEVGLPEE